MFNEIFNNLIKLNQIFDKNKKVVIFGAGAGGKATFFVLKTLSISPICFVDNDPSLMGSKMFDIPIEKPSYLLNINKDEFMVLVSSIYYEEISGQLMDMGFKENYNYFRMINSRNPYLWLPALLKEITYFSEFGFSVGKYTYYYRQFFNLKKPLLERIGAFCSIAKKCNNCSRKSPIRVH